jgi:hypothetical protein
MAIDEQRVIARAQTDWRRVARWTILLSVVSAALALGIRTTTIIRHRGTPCVEIKDKDAGRTHPSPGCERIARLIFRVCAIKPDVCFGAARSELRKLTPRQRRAFERSLASLVPGLTGAPTRTPPPRARRGHSTPHRPPGHRRPTAHAPPPRPSPTRTPPPPARPSPPSRPTPSDVLNHIKDRARDTANDTTQSVGAGRPVPPLPDLPPTPALPDVCDLLKPTICP